MASGSLEGRVCLVTGASRGLGRGIALQLGQAGATVYITGRTLNSKPGVPGSLLETAKEVEERGGKCHAIQCDHSKDDDIKRLFDTISKQQNGRLDILVNNAYSAVNHFADTFGLTFWEQGPEVWDIVNNVGLRNHYICSVYAARMMVTRKSGLIVNLSSMGGINYLFSAAYGIGKTACDRMASDCAFELKKHGVAYISLWPGMTKTETFVQISERETPLEGMVNEHMSAEQFKSRIHEGESTELAGKAIVALAKDARVINKTGKIHMTVDLAEEYGFTDIDGSVPQNFRSLSVLAGVAGYKTIANYIPTFIRLPKWALWMSACLL